MLHWIPERSEPDHLRPAVFFSSFIWFLRKHLKCKNKVQKPQCIDLFFLLPISRNPKSQIQAESEWCCAHVATPEWQKSLLWSEETRFFIENLIHVQITWGEYRQSKYKLALSILPFKNYRIISLHLFYTMDHIFIAKHQDIWPEKGTWNALLQN